MFLNDQIRIVARTFVLFKQKVSRSQFDVDKANTDLGNFLDCQLVTDDNTQKHDFPFLLLTD